MIFVLLQPSMNMSCLGTRIPASSMPTSRTGVKIEPKNGLDHPALLPVSQLKLFDCQKIFIVVLEWHFVIMVVTLKFLTFQVTSIQNSGIFLHM